MRRALRDVEWLNPAATPLQQHDWEDPAGRTLMIRLSGAWLLLVKMHPGINCIFICLRMLALAAIQRGRQHAGAERFPPRQLAMAKLLVQEVTQE